MIIRLCDPLGLVARLLLVLVVAGTALAQGVDTGAKAEAAALRDVKRAFRPVRDVADAFAPRRAALESLRSSDSPEVVDVLVDAYQQVEKEALEAEEPRRAYLRRGFRDKHLEPRPGLDDARSLHDEILSQLAGLERPDTVEALVARGLEERRLPVTLRASLVARAGAPAQPVVVAAQRAKKSEDVFVALTALAATGPEARDGGGRVADWLAHDDALIRETAIRAAVALRSPLVIEPLVQRLEEEPLRARGRIAAALKQLTGAGIGPSPAGWRQWLEREGAAFTSGERPLGAGVDVNAAKAARAAGPQYYGIPLDGESILFVFDRSKSMQKKIDAGATRFAAAKAELVRALGQLRAGVRFNILAFGGTLDGFSEEMTAADPETVATAQVWVEALDMNLGTRLYDALDQAFVIGGRPTLDRYYDPALDTICVLTDGAPIVNGKSDSKERILSAVARWNLGRRVVIHVVGVGRLPKYMRRLAEDNGGRFVRKE
ncbi:MAG: VWA domain-containing protein [bacterium]|nr:VWA domain-containing protein [bacterium]